MAKTLASIVLTLALNLLFFTLVSSTDACAPPPKESQKSNSNHCPKDALKFRACANLLQNTTRVAAGSSSKTSCCSLISGLVDLEAAVCLCTAIRANVLGINLNMPISLSLVLNQCGKETPSGFQCA